MKKYSIILVFIVCCLNVFSQDEKLNIDANYPIPVGSSFISKSYSGVFDIGLNYTLVKVSVLRLGVATNVGFLSSSGVSFNTLMLKPRLVLALSVWKFTPYAGMGYSLFSYLSKTTIGGDNTNDGLTTNFGLRIYLISKLYFNANCDLIKFRPEKMLNNSYNRNIKNLEFGLGISL